jgi:SAM-dependent methyltransferase
MLMKWVYRLAYLTGRTPWDTGITPPELVEVVEGARALPPGRALDLGCGTGTNVLYLAEHGWEVTGVDLARQPLAHARRLVGAAGAAARLLHGDVTRLDSLGVGDGYSLVFDLGCYHSIPVARRDAYAEGVTRAAAPGATLLMYGFGRGVARRGLFSAGMSADELRRRFTGWELTAAIPGTGPFDSAWYELHRSP